jgi:hypothetical protein
MSRIPYSGLSANTDPNLNSNSYDDYDPYGERYGTPPIGGATSGRRGGMRAGGYGGFYENSNGSASVLQPISQPSQQPERYDGYSGGASEESAPAQSARWLGGPNSNNVRRIRPDGRDTDSSEGSRGPEYRGAEPSRQNDGTAGNDVALGRGTNGKVGGDGTRQIDGW